MSGSPLVSSYIESIKQATDQMSRILNTQSQSGSRAFASNEDVLLAFCELIQRILNLNDAKPHRRLRTAGRTFKDSTFFIDIPLRHAPLAQLESELTICDKTLREAFESALRQPGKPPFLGFCQAHGLSFHEQLVLAMIPIKEEDCDFSSDRLICTNDILDTLGGYYMPMETAKAYFRETAPLRKNGIIELYGAGHVVTNCHVRLNPDHLKEIYGKDYDEKITHFSRFAMDERSRTGSFPEEDPKVPWDTLVLPEHIKEAIRTGLTQAKHQEVFLEAFGFGKTIPSGRGVSFLFSGPPGTGKTMAARAIASELGKKLIAVSYAQLESPWVGMTEKNIEKCFDEAAKKGAVLLFDEAEAVFFARRSTEHSWANRDVAVLLQCIEKFEGVVILTTNVGAMLDPALERRVGIKIQFPMPDAKAREEIFRRMAPGKERLADDVDFRRLSEKYEFSGGQIKNVWLNAGRMALGRMEQVPIISMKDLETAVRIEQKGGEAMQTRMDVGKTKGYA